MQRFKIFFTLLLSFVIFSLAINSIHAATFNIADGDVYGPNGLVAAINTANTNGEADTINLAPNSIYVLTYLYNPGQIGDPYEAYPSGTPVIFNDLTINGNGSTIKRDENSTDYFRILTIRGGNVNLNDTTITGGNLPSNTLNGYMGGGILNGQGAGLLTIKNSKIMNNHATNGSGVATLWANITIDSSEISGNTEPDIYGGVWGQGGGVWLGSYNSSNLQANIKDSTISNNNAIYGGGVYSGVSHLTVNKTKFLNNSATWGGGINMGTFYNEGTLDVADSNFSNNTAYSGGGIYGLNIVTASVTGTRFVSNQNSAIISDFTPNAYGEATRSFQIHNNCFTGNVNVGLGNYLTSLPVDATNNWWGSDTGPGWDAPGLGDGITGYNFTYIPFVTGGCPLDHVNQAPTVSANGPYTVVEGSSVQLSATGNDPENGPLTYAWDLDNNGSFETAGQTATFSAVGVTASAIKTVKVQVTDNGGLTATSEATISINYNYTGFFSPVDNLPTFNEIKAGKSVPVKFSLNGDHGLNIFAVGYPKSEPVNCNSNDQVDGIEETTTNPAGLTYNPTSGQYSYVWKTDSSWTNCRQFIVQFIDGTFQRANFKFK